MSCPRCGGVLAEELSNAMVALVCGMVVIEGRYCHCDDPQGPVQSNLPPDADDSLDGQSRGPNPLEGMAS